MEYHPDGIDFKNSSEKFFAISPSQYEYYFFPNDSIDGPRKVKLLYHNVDKQTLIFAIYGSLERLHYNYQSQEIKIFRSPIF